MICTTLLNPSFDLIYTTPISGKTTYLDLPTRLFPAGKGVNCAKVIAALGEEVSLFSMMPEEDELRFSRYLEEHGIIHQPCLVPGSVRINTTVFEEQTKSTLHYNSEGNKLSTRIQDHFLRMIDTKISDGDLWLFSGSLPKGIEQNFYETMIGHCQNSNVETIVDTRDKPLEYALKAVPTIVTPNESELEYLFDEPIHGIKHLALKGKRLIDSGIEYVYITLGQDGVIALHENECILCKAPEIETVDTVGCGDAFMAGIAVGKQRGFSFSESCRLAVACGASNASHLGPGQIDNDQVWHFMEDVKVSSI